MSTPSAAPVEKLLQSIVIQSPKARFRESGDNISKHRQLIDNPAFARAVDFAMLQYQAEMQERLARAVPGSEMNMSAMIGLKLQGAAEFVHQLRLLSEEVKVPLNTPRTDNLNHSTS